MNPKYQYFYDMENSFGKQRERAKEAYWDSPDMTLKDYKGTVHDIPMGMDIFQKGTEWSYLRNPVDVPIDMYLAIGLAEEIGETVSHIKKKYRDDNGVLTDKRRAKLIEEAGDAFYYFAAFLNSLDISLEEVAKLSQEKSVHRFKERFMNK